MTSLVTHSLVWEDNSFGGMGGVNIQFFATSWTWWFGNCPRWENTSHLHPVALFIECQLGPPNGCHKYCDQRGWVAFTNLKPLFHSYCLYFKFSSTFATILLGHRCDNHAYFPVEEAEAGRSKRICLAKPSIEPRPLNSALLGRTFIGIRGGKNEHEHLPSANTEQL